jgi:hypothetical protein
MSGWTDAAKAAVVTAGVVDNAVTGQGPGNDQAFKVALQQAQAQSAQIEQATRATGQPRTGQR